MEKRKGRNRVFLKEQFIKYFYTTKLNNEHCFRCRKCGAYFHSVNDCLNHIIYHEEIEPKLTEKEIRKELAQMYRRKQKKITQFQ